MFTMKDHENFLADVMYVKKESRNWTNVQFLKSETCTRVSYSTASYSVVEWVHPTYTRTLAIAKDNSHAVAWSEISGEIHRW